MNVHFLITADAVALSNAGSKDEILELLAARFATAYELDLQDVLDHLREREALGSTGFGRGVAIPHARIGGLQRPVGVLLKLDSPVDFAAADGMPVDLVFGLVSPENAGATHLHALAAISRLTRDDAMRDALTAADTPEVLYGLITNAGDRDAA
ncbi:PTS sugar transporter subunit IIA [Paraurantiacibacter namhicola]|uniref:Nitrogen regulatory protein n=1 Tax=Paraurantiacibacter namhicola TaxID=645517 RepID=A0A1C7D5Y2_9SPHN|nr:PTS sugar transporter subunit IIA [Paraurantiacibacter namhicola]ANU06762.1 Nitrogen regulatory protein [Paraurantiacibacter namhicola]